MEVGEMKISVLKLKDGARHARGTTVIIDVFRAFSVEAYLFAMGVAEIVPVGEQKTAEELKKADGSVVLIGERNGIKIDGFDYGNSPSQILKGDLEGKKVVHTTSAGTQGIVNAVNADEILVCGLVNARATAEYIKEKNPEEVSLVAMGLNGVTPTQEDDLCAEYIKSILLGEPKDLSAQVQALRFTDGAKFFDLQQQEVFPQEDFWLCTAVDRFDFALKYFKTPDGLGVVKKVTVSK